MCKINALPIELTPLIYALYGIYMNPASGVSLKNTLELCDLYKNWINRIFYEQISYL